MIINQNTKNIDSRYSGKVLPEHKSKKYYHATYKPLLEKIKKQGLLPEKAGKNFDVIEKGIYIDRTKEGAKAFAEINENVPEEWIDDIIVFEFTAKQIKDEFLEYDPNMITSAGQLPQTFIYKNILKVDSITK